MRTYSFSLQGGAPWRRRTSREGPIRCCCRSGSGLYEALRREGSRRKKSARTANAAAKTSRSEVGHKGGEAENYEDRTKEELVDRPGVSYIKGRSRCPSRKLIDALRNS